MQGVDHFYNAMRERDIRHEYHMLRCNVCHKDIKGFMQQQYVDALDTFCNHIRGKDHQRKVRHLSEEDSWQEFRAAKETDPVWLHHANGSVFKGGWRYRYRPWQDDPEETRKLDWSLWQKVYNLRERRYKLPLTQFLHPSDIGDGEEDVVRVRATQIEPTSGTGADFEAPNRSLRPDAHLLKNKLWEELLNDDEMERDLTESLDEFDWREYLRGIPKLSKAVPDLNEVTKFAGELHRTAKCSWTNSPRFHFVATTARFRILLSQHASRKCVLIFEDLERNFLSIDDTPGEDGEPSYPIPREQDVVEAFGGNCFHMRKMKNRLLQNSELSFKEVVRRFLGIDDTQSLLDIAKERSLVQFDALRLIWKLRSDANERSWRQFLGSQGTKITLDQGFTEAVECDRLHDEISRAVEELVQRPSDVTWQTCFSKIRRCHRCSQDFAEFLNADELAEAVQACRWHCWAGSWTLRVKEIFYTHDTISRRFKDGRAVQATLDELLNDPRKLQEIPQMRVMFYHGKFHSIDNRRLWCFKELAKRTNNGDLSVTVELHAIAGASRRERIAGRWEQPGDDGEIPGGEPDTKRCGKPMF
eukprot:s492_g27.t1